MTSILYKRTTTGKVQRWQQELSGNRYRTISGQVDGKLVTSEWTVCKGKNIGRSNETSPEEQARLEVEAHYKKKLDYGGYKRNVKDIDVANFFKPMLAKDYEKYKPTDDMYDAWMVYSQPKLDGMRCIATKDGLWSRVGKPILSVPHIHEALAPIFAAFPTAVLDGELYADKLANDFNQIMSLCKQKKPTKDDFDRSRDVIKYFVYDIPSLPGGFEIRTRYLWNLLDEHGEFEYSHDAIVYLETTVARDKSQLDDCYASYVEKGMEGQIVRIGGTDYENKRTKNLLKRKDFQDREYTIVDILEGTGNRSGMAGSIVYDLGDGRTFNSNLTGGMEFYRKLLRNKNDYIGSQGTVKFFELTPDGIPRFPVTTMVYEDGRDC